MKKILKKIISILFSSIFQKVCFILMLICSYANYKLNDTNALIYSGLLTIIFLIFSLTEREDS